MSVSSPSPRVVLVEVTTPPRLHTNLSFPFVHGFLAARGIASRWLRFAYPPDVALRMGGAGAAFPAADLEALVERLRADEATHVLLGVIPGEPLLAILRERLPDCVVAVMAGESQAMSEDASMDGLSRLDQDLGEIWRWLGGRSKVAGRLFDSVARPRYDWEPGNAVAAGPSQPPVFVLVAPECLHRPPLHQSAFFAEAADLELPERWGCSFCTSACLADTAPRAKPASLAEDLRRQLSCIFESHPPVDGPLPVRMSGARPALDPMALVEVLDELGAPPCRFLFDYRADHLVRREAAVREAVAALGARGHRFEIVLMGLESFSAAQLDRYHKGYGPEVNLRAVRLLAELESELAPHFGYREHGGLSTVLFDPWVRFGDVLLNLSVARVLGLEKVLGKLFTSRLRLYDALPLAPVARRDGLLVEHYDDPLLDTARRNFYADERPWRFAEPRMEAVNRLLTRLTPEGEGAADALTEEVARLRASLDASVIECAEAFARAALASEQPLSPEALLRTTREAGLAPVEELGAVVEDDALLWDEPFAFLPDFAAFVAGHKPVIKVEGYPDEGLERFIAALEARGEDLFVLRRARAEIPGRTGSANSTEFFVARAKDEPLARRAAELTESLERIEFEQDAARYVDAVAQVGVLLGYPACCARAFAAQESAYRGRYEWLRLRRRIEAPGPAPAETGPQALSFLPCRVDCPEALAFSRAAAEALAREREALAARRPALARELLEVPEGSLSPEQRAATPTIRFFDDESRYAALLPLGPLETLPRVVAGAPVHRFRYRLLDSNLPAREEAALLAGDTLEVAPGLIRVLAGETERGVFALEAWLWSAELAFHPAFWREVLASPRLGRPGQDPEERAAAPPVSVAAPDAHAERRAALRDTVAGLMARFTATGGPLPGIALQRVSDRSAEAGWGLIEVETRHEGAAFVVRIGPGELPGPRFRESARFALSHAPETPADRPERVRFMELLLRALERVVPSGAGDDARGALR